MILINREYGAGNNEKTSVLMNTLIRLILIISLIFLMMFPFIPWLLKLISTPDEFSDLLSILSHIAVSLRMELLLTQDTRQCQYQ